MGKILVAILLIGFVTLAGCRKDAPAEQQLARESAWEWCKAYRMSWAYDIEICQTTIDGVPYLVCVQPNDNDECSITRK